MLSITSSQECSIVQLMIPIVEILSIVLAYHLPGVCICYGHKMRMNGIFGAEFKPVVME